MGTRIAGSNKSKLKNKENNEDKKCVCRGDCPVSGECHKNDVIYEAVVTDHKQRSFKYIGKTSTEFIVRYRNHVKDMKHVAYMKNCELSKKVWSLKDKNKEYSIEWKIRNIVKSYQAGDPYCKLCLEEVNQIIFYDENETLLNTHSELYKKYRHRSKFKQGLTLVG